MKPRNFVVILFLFTLLGSGRLFADPTDPRDLLQQCLIAFMDGAEPADGHTFGIGTTINPPIEPPKSLASARVVWDQLEEFQSDKIHMYRGIDARGGSDHWIWRYVDPTHVDPDGTPRPIDYSRPMTWADFHSLRWHLSLSPYWVISHVLSDYYDDYMAARYTQGEDPENPGFILYLRVEPIQLTDDDDEGLQGLYMEQLVIDPVQFEIVSYTITSEDGDGVFFQDMRNEYEYNWSQDGHLVSVTVSQGSSLNKGIYYYYQVAPVAQ